MFDNRLKYIISIFILSILSFDYSSCFAQEQTEESEDWDYRVTTLDNLQVTAKHNKYSKKNNPAYDLMTQIRASKDIGDPKTLPEYSRDYYSKIIMGLNNCDASQFKGKDKLKFLREYVDTASYSGFPVLIISLKETGGKILHSSENKIEKLLVTRRMSVGIDYDLNNANITLLLQDLFKNIDNYIDDIPLLHQRFVSPLSKLSDNFYRYYLNDTVEIDKKKYLELVFAPRSAESFGFNGRMFVEANDSSYFVKRVEMRVPRVINLNYIDNIYITQEFEKDIFGKRHIVSDDMELELQIMPGTPTFYARRKSGYSKPKYSVEDKLKGFLNDISDEIVYENADQQPWEEWENLRLIPLSSPESQVGSFMSKLRQYPLIYWSEKILKLLVHGYIKTGKNSKFDIGPINSIISYNSIEGWRLRAGGFTTANLSPHIFGRGYVAYGFKDKKFKYNAELEYSFNKKKYHSREFPMNLIRLRYGYELDQVGQHYLYTNSDNIFLSLKRKSSKLSLYKRAAALDYELELRNNFSIKASFSHNIFESSPWLPFITSSGENIRKYALSGLSVQFRYAPGEKFSQGVLSRYNINRDAPVILLSHEIYPKGFLGSRFTVNRTVLTLSKRFWFSAFGYLDCILKGGKIWSKVDYPELLWQNANLSYTIQPESYSLLNPMEFPMDYYGSLDLGYHANGLIFNHIPGIKRLKLREVVTFKGFMGGLTDKNNPAKNPELMSFPAGTATGRLTAKPYMEMSVGIENILTFLRVDYVWRLSYRNLPDVSRGGVRLSANFTF